MPDFQRLQISYRCGLCIFLRKLRVSKFSVKILFMPTYTESILKERAERDQRLTADPLNWLALCGRFFLEEGENSIGSAESDKIVLPILPAPRAVVLTITGDKATLTEHMDGVTVNGSDPEPRSLRSDVDGDQDTITCGRVAMQLIIRGGTLILRTWDLESEAVKKFKGLHYYPVKPEFRIKAKYTPYDPPLARKTYNAIGNELDSTFAGFVEFGVDGIDCRLDAEDGGDELLLNFTDMTKIDATYPGGRYITISKPVPAEVILDFNTAVNWPCAYTNFATCPLPPFENRLKARIEAGELRFHD